MSQLFPSFIHVTCIDSTATLTTLPWTSPLIVTLLTVCLSSVQQENDHICSFCRYTRPYSAKHENAVRKESPLAHVDQLCQDCEHKKETLKETTKRETSRLISLQWRKGRTRGHAEAKTTKPQTIRRLCGKIGSTTQITVRACRQTAARTKR